MCHYKSAIEPTALNRIIELWRLCAAKCLSRAKNNEPYRYSIPSTTEAKFARLRIKATGERKKSGNAKGAGRPEGYGSGVKTKAVPALKQVYAANHLPAVQELKPGEKVVLEREGLTQFAVEINTPKRVPKKKAPVTDTE